MANGIVPFKLKAAPAFIEHLFPVQKLSVESFKEQEARQSKTLTTLGSFWKGRKPLILNRACIFGVLLPVTENRKKDLEIFELLMGMDDESLRQRLGIGIDEPLPSKTYRELVEDGKRPEEIGESLNAHIWERVNSHLGTDAHSISELVEQLGIMRFGRRPKFTDTFAGSGQIPFEAARVGCDVYASDLNPMACLLTWGAFHVVGASTSQRRVIKAAQEELFSLLTEKIDELEIETDSNGWRGKAYLYCTEVTCPQSGWVVPLLQSLLVSKGHKVVATLVPNSESKSYHVALKYDATDAEMSASNNGTLRSEGRDSYLVHTVAGVTYRTKISTLRGDFTPPGGTSANNLRLWEKTDLTHRDDDIYRERLYAILWVRKDEAGRLQHQFREIGPDDLRREAKALNFLRQNLGEWQAKGYVPDSRIEAGDKTDEPIRTRGWTHWHHLFNPRQLLLCGLINQLSSAQLTFGFCQVLNNNSKLSRWNARSGVGQTASVFDNQALNTLFNYGCRGSMFCEGFLDQSFKHFPLRKGISFEIQNHPANLIEANSDILITDPPYGDAVKYEEILEYFICWLAKKPNKEFASWTWDSRRALAIKGEDEAFRNAMVSAYTKMTAVMSDNGIQIIMFTHQSGSIWADMANIVWASGLRVTAAWYVVTETDNPLHEGSYVKGTVLLVLRKRMGTLKTSRDDLAWEIQEEVNLQVHELTGLNQEVRSQNRDENIFEDADLQMAGYAAALRVLTKYSIIDGRQMAAEAVKPRVDGQTTFVDSLIEFAVGTANQALVPSGLQKTHWDKLMPAERFILKMTDLEARGAKTLDNYQNFAKAFKVRDFTPFLQSRRANDAKLKGAVEFGRTEMSEGSELHMSTLRAVYYAVMELVQQVDSNDVVQHLSFNVKDYYSAPAQREMVVALSNYIAGKVENMRPEEASAARVLAELVKNQRLG